jgi:CxxC motif-containing protein
MKYIENPDSCFMCVHFTNGECQKHHVSLGKLYALVNQKNPYRVVETMINIICTNGFKRKTLKLKDPIIDNLREMSDTIVYKKIRKAGT